MLTRLFLVIYRLFVVLFIFFICRLGFLFFNLSSFQPIETGQIMKSFFYGFRFDYSAIYYLNIPWILMMLVPGFVYRKPNYQAFIKAYFVVVNAMLISVNIADIMYFKFINSRSGFDVIKTLFTSTDVLMNVPAFVLSYWYLLVGFITLIWVLTKLYSKSFLGINHVQEIKWYYVTFIYLLFHMFSLIAARGLGLKPLRMISAVEYVSPKYVPLVLNTPFSIVNTMNETDVREFDYFHNQKDLKRAFDVYYSVENKDTFQHLNVVVFILESFSAEYIGTISGKQSHTPYLDSLITKSFVCYNGMANSQRSVDALPAILSSLPSLAGKSHIESKYSVNALNSLSDFLKAKGYHTSYFHGGKNGTMGFDAFSQSIGIEKYYGMNEYPDQTKYDGAWGIPDHYFLSFMVDEINTFKRPFFSCAFTLSSHHPYKVPQEFEEKFKGGELPILKAIEYADYSVRTFMEKASKQDWYDNTLFVFTADHTAQTLHPEFQNRRGYYRIPIIFYHPLNNSLKGYSNQVAQQIDIFPSILDYLNYDTTFVSFGSSVFDTATSKFGVNSVSSNFFYFNDSICGTFNGKSFIDLYNYNKDTFMLNNIADEIDDQLYLMQVKSYIQQYFTRLKNNQLNR